MSYTHSRSPLGYDLVVNVPMVGPQKIVVPLEKMMDDGVGMLKKRIPELVDQAVPIVTSKLMPVLEQKVVPLLTKTAEKELPKLIPKLLPMVQPALRKEIDYAVDKAKGVGTTVAFLVALGVCVPIAASTWYLTKQIRKR